VSNSDYGPGMWSSEPLGGKEDPEGDVSPGAEVAIGGDPFGLSGRGAVEPDAPHKDASPDDAQGRQSEVQTRDVLSECEQHPSSQPTKVGGGTPGGTASGEQGSMGADRQGFSGPGNPGSVANEGTV
jgi:hypothetical protein